MQQLHVKLAFLNSKLSNKTQILPARSISLNREVLQLCKPFNGCKQGLLWSFLKLASALTEVSLISLHFDLYLFLKHELTVIPMVCVYDVTTVGKSLEIKILVKHLKFCFSVPVTHGLKYIFRIHNAIK